MSKSNGHQKLIFGKPYVYFTEKWRKVKGVTSSSVISLNSRGNGADTMNDTLTATINPSAPSPDLMYEDRGAPFLGCV
jgi:hypothetical protein